MTRPKAKQLALEFRSWGGARAGAGRKRTKKHGSPHVTRARLASRYPVHVTVRLEEGLPSLRRKGTYRVVREAFRAGSDRFGFRLAHYAVLGNHVHMIVEAKDRVALSRGMQGLQIRLAKALNRLWRRTGRVFADRYHDHILRAPREVWNALRYVLLNARRHGIRTAGLDPYSSGAWFDGWKSRVAEIADGLDLDAPIARARTWLLEVGWRRHGRIHPSDVPGR